MAINTPGEQFEQNEDNEKASALSDFSNQLGDLKNLIDSPSPSNQDAKEIKTEALAEKSDAQEAKELLDTLKGSDDLNRSEAVKTTEETVNNIIGQIPTMKDRGEYAKNAEELYAKLGGEQAVDNMISSISNDPRGLGLKYGNFAA